ncbi:HNH endonuclease family protein [Erythrobacter sp.]|nr:HNH endonuclease family protein [Erythrobacter sp.]
MRHSTANAEGEEIDLQELMASIRHFADLFERIDRPAGKGRFNRFLGRLKAIDVIVFHPLLLAIMDQAGDDEAELAKVAEVLESFLVRRMVCNYRTRGYGSLALKLLEEITERSSTEPLSEILSAELSENDTVPDKWPDDAEFRDQWLHRRFYGSLRRDRVLMILRAIEEYYQTSSTLAEPIVAFDWCAVQVEHVMPQKWVEHWPLPDALPADDRDFQIHGIGNLTLVSGRLNPKMSNGPWLPNDRTTKCKRDALEAHTLLYLNKNLLKSADDEWDEGSIAQRAEAMFQVASIIWSNKSE